MTHVHRWALEPCLQSRRRIVGGEYDGELYTERLTRGNIEGVCKDAGCQESRTFHPFAGMGDGAPAFNLALRVSNA
ncbi:hypothetical protein LCGC14_0288470 [marine sediment metagenome]|uniref:Uncharacterized protein n=1 Tax=marine sediment metagenome TaxID=412755 RepID=A0A0F9TTM7_9ZZZZ